MRIKIALTCLAAAVGILGAGLVWAQDPSGTTLEMESVTVTANKVEEDITDVPQSITVITDEILKEKGIKDIPDIINEIPNMAYKFDTAGNVNFRGVNTSVFTNNHPVVIYIDGVPCNNMYGFDVSLVNAERIEVLRGPQGTLYGKDAIGAVIKVVTKEPENEWHGNIGTEYASYNNMQGSFNVNGPLIQDKLYLGLNTRYQQDDGWITNDYTGDDKANKGSLHNLGGYLLYTPTDRFSAKVILSNDHYKDYGFTGCALPGGTDASEFDRDDAEHISVDEESITETDSLAQSVYLKYEFDTVTLSSTTTHRGFDAESVGDRDYMADTAYDGLVMLDYTDIETWTQELRLVSNNKEGVRWVAGVYFDTEDVEKGPYGIQFYSSGSAYEMNFESQTESDTMALFGQMMIPFLNSFELTLGVRFQRIDREMDLDTYYNPVGVSIWLTRNFYPDREHLCPDRESIRDPDLPKGHGKKPPSKKVAFYKQTVFKTGAFLKIKRNIEGDKILFDFLYTIDYILHMYTVKTLPEFDKWLNSLKNRITRLRLSRHPDKAQRGNPGDVKPVGEGIFEMREHFGPGWRMYSHPAG